MIVEDVRRITFRDADGDEMTLILNGEEQGLIIGGQSVYLDDADLADLRAKIDERLAEPVDGT